MPVPDTNCAKNMSVVLGGFPGNINTFMAANEAAWQSEGYEWPTADDYKLDGYTLAFEFQLSDTNAA